MFKFSIAIIFILLASLFIFGCSSSDSNPVSSIAGEIDANQASHELLGVYTAEFDLESLSTTVLTNRDPAFHYNVKPYLPFPGITINSWDPVEEILDVDVSIINVADFGVWDIRLIIFTDAIGHELLNSDGWTGMYDIPGGNDVNPFKSYADPYNPYRYFYAKESVSNNLLIHMPGGVSLVQFAIDASIGGNCEEPYMIEKNDQSILYNAVDAIADYSVRVFDWQDDVSDVSLECTEIFDTVPMPLSHLTGNVWEGTISNVNGAAPGEYIALVSALSSNSGSITAYDYVTVEIHSNEVAIFPDLGLEAAIRDAISKPTGDIYVHEVLPLTELDANARNIWNLEGIGFCRNLTKLYLNSNNISDLTPLTDLTELIRLDIELNQLVDISPLSSLTTLNRLYMSQNQIVDISALQYLVELYTVYMDLNSITDIFPLVLNPGMGDDPFDFISIRVNPLSSDSINNWIPELESRGVTVSWE